MAVYTSSDQPPDRERATELRASDFIVKESQFEKMVEVAQGLVGRWL